MSRIDIHPGQVYRHFKGDVYVVVGLGIHTETLERLVIYKNLGASSDILFARPASMFVSLVDTDKYPNATQKYRFELVSESEF